MRQSILFSRTQKEAPKDEVAKNAELLLRGGFVHKEMAGVYSFLPLGLRVLERINAVIREEMNRIGGQEVLMSVLQNKQVWEKTGRWSDEAVGTWFKTVIKDGAEAGLGFTHEEPLTNLMRRFVSSYADLPKLIYQIQWKFRNEERAKSGLMRGREFLMKDLYTFAASPEEHEELYERVAAAYHTVFNRIGIGDRTYRTFASGGVFSKYSHEFQCELAVGEDTIYVDRKKRVAINKEVNTAEVRADLGVREADLEEVHAVEVGNIFSLGIRFSEPLGLVFKDAAGATKPVVMGSYGIGPGRCMGTIVEIYHDEKGIMWPEAVAPFAVHLLLVGEDEGELRAFAEAAYAELEGQGIETLYDDRARVSAGEKFADADLVGIPWRAVVSARTMESGKLEVKRRNESEARLMKIAEFMKFLK